MLRLYIIAISIAEYLAMTMKACYTSATMSGDATRHALLIAVARWLSQRHLHAPVIFLLEVHRPFAFAAGQFTLFFQPLLSLWLSDESVNRFAAWLSDEKGLDQFIGLLQGEP